MYDELLPRVDPVGHEASGVSGQRTEDNVPLEDLRRAAQLAGPDDRRLVAELIAARMSYLALGEGGPLDERAPRVEASLNNSPEAEVEVPSQAPGRWPRKT